ncbi:MAG: hypothetical protein MHMPM18_001064 [Marteilia pararefringens]
MPSGKSQKVQASYFFIMSKSTTSNSLGLVGKGAKSDSDELAAIINEVRIQKSLQIKDPHFPPPIKDSQGIDSQGHHHSSKEFEAKMMQLLQGCWVKNQKIGNMNEYMENTRQIYLVNYSIKVKNDEIERLKRDIVRQRTRIGNEEQRLKEVADRFDSDLKESDTKAVEAIRAAEKETKRRLAKERDLRKLRTDLYTTSASCTALRERLDCLRTYHRFVVDKIQPWYVEMANDDREGGEDEQQPDLLTSSPKFLERLFKELEENNYKLIVKNQEISDSVDDLKIAHSIEKFKIEQEIELVRDNENFLTSLIDRESGKAREFQTRVRLYSYGDYYDQDALLADLERQIAEISETKGAAIPEIGAAAVAAAAGNKSHAPRLNSRSAETHLLNIEKRLDALLGRREAVIPQERFQNARRLKEREWQAREREIEELKAKKEREARALKNKKVNAMPQTNLKLKPNNLQSKRSNQPNSNHIERLADPSAENSRQNQGRRLPVVAKVPRNKKMNEDSHGLKSANHQSSRRQANEDEAFYFKF